MSGLVSRWQVFRVGVARARNGAMTVGISDEDLLSVLPYARGYDREMLVGALGASTTRPSSETVAELKRLYATEKGHTRVAALHSLCSRLGPAGTDYAVEALSSTYWGLQEVGAALLVEHGGADTAGPFFDWFERKLKSNDRPRNWSPDHLLTALRFALRHDLHLQLAGLLVKHWSHLAGEEREWLALHWAGLFDAAGTPRAGDQTPPPRSVGVLGTYLLDELHPPQTLEQRLAVEEQQAQEHAAQTADAYRRALRRRERTKGSG
jgi:hypothetical protein